MEWRPTVAGQALPPTPGGPPPQTRIRAPGAPRPPGRQPAARAGAQAGRIPVCVSVRGEAARATSGAGGDVFWIAGAPEQRDGVVARRWRVELQFGKIVDPLADRLMIDAAVILLVAYGRLPWEALVVIIARDLLLLAGWRVLAPRGIDLDVNVVGKGATWLLYLAIGCRIVTHDHTVWPLVLFWIGLAAAVVAALFYVRDAWKALRA